MCRSRRELSNAYLLAKFGFDTAENEPSKVLHHLDRAAEPVPVLHPRVEADLGGAVESEAHGLRSEATLRGSFSAVSTQIFAAKYSLIK